MLIPINYSGSFQYPDKEDGITLRVILTAGDRVREAFAKVDTGAAVCLFSMEVGMLLGLDIEKGIPIRLETLSGTLDAFGHEITMALWELAWIPLYLVVFEIGINHGTFSPPTTPN